MKKYIALLKNTGTGDYYLGDEELTYEAVERSVYADSDLVAILEITTIIKVVS